MKSTPSPQKGDFKSIMAEKFQTWKISTINWYQAQSKPKLALKTIGGLALAGIGFILLLFLLVWMGAFGTLPNEKDVLSIQNDTATEIYSADGELLGKYFLKNRTNVNYKEISPNIINALVATEDARFFEHQGIDARAWVRVFLRTVLLRDESGGGGSTLSQQLAKNLYPRTRYRVIGILVNKMKEMFVAKRLERVYTKEQLLSFYLNTVPFGGNIYGVSVAAKQFFSKTPKEVNIQEAAMLVGMLKANTYYNPVRNPEQALSRRNTVLNQMKKYKYVDEATIDSLKKTEIELEYSRESNNEGLATYFREHLRLELDDVVKEIEQEDGTPYNLYKDGLKIYTTIDSRMQEYAEEAVAKHLSKLQTDFDKHWKGKKPWKDDAVLERVKKNSTRYKKLKKAGLSESDIKKNFDTPVNMTIFDWKEGDVTKEISPMDSIKYYFCLLNAGFLVMDHQTGDIKAWVGGIDHQYYQYDHIKSKRPVGSTFKPIVYTAALQKGIMPCDYQYNRLVTYTEYEDWQPRNADNQYGGVYSMKGALTKSVNSVAVNYILQAQIDSVITLAHKMGVTSDIPEVPSIALGTVEASLYDMTKVYGTIANGGRRPEPRYISRIETSDGRLIKEFEYPEPEEWEQVIDSDYAGMMGNMLESVVDSGTARRLRYVYNLPNQIAGKTGTTQNHSDGWFMGFTPNLVAGAWVGGESPVIHFRDISLGSGGNMALPIWGEFMAKLNRDKAFSNDQYAMFPILEDSLQYLLECPPFLDDMPMDEPEILVVDNPENLFEEAIDQVVEALKKRQKRINEKPQRGSSSRSSTESERVKRNNEKLEKKRKRKKKQKKLLDKIFKKN